jgi:hypothetical protein
MIIELIVSHGMDVDWLSTRPINVLFDLYEQHIKTMISNPMMPFGMGGNMVSPKDDKYSTKSWVDGNKKVSRVNLLNSDNVQVIEGLKKR